jgi:hypothetical protein
MLRVMNALMSQLFVLILKFLSGIGLLVHDVLQVGLRCLQLVNTCFKLCRQALQTTQHNVRLQQGTPISTQWLWRTTYLCSSGTETCSSGPSRRSLLASPTPRCGTGRRHHQAWIAQGGVLLGLVQLLLQGLSAEHRVTVPLKHIRLLLGSLNDVLQRATQSTSTHYKAMHCHSEYSQGTLIHCSARRIDSML